MYITCPNCATNFTISEEQIGSFARKVKCSKCGNIWHHYPKEQIQPQRLSHTSIHNNKIELGRGVNLPMLTPIRPKEPESPKFLQILLTCLIICLSFLLFQENLGLKGLINYHKLNIKDIKINSNLDDNKIVVHYTIMNLSNKTVPIPLAQIRLFDKHNKLIKSSIVDNTKTNIPPNDYVTIESELKSENTVEQVDITLGNRLDFILK